jgi:hypothetical protein
MRRFIQEYSVYLSETQHNKYNITAIQRAEDAYVWMDRFTIEI